MKGLAVALVLLPCVSIRSEGERAALMAGLENPLSGEHLLSAVTDAMVELHLRHYKRKPVTAKTVLLGDDLLACVLGGIYTDVEKTMIEIQRGTIVQETRNDFQNAMQQRFISTVQDFTGRRVLAFISDHHFGPDVEIELFFLAPASGAVPGDAAGSGISGPD